MAELLRRERNVALMNADRTVPGTDFSPVVLNSLGGREYNSYEEIVSVDELTNKQKSVSHFQIRI